jgi:hypothetical protein
MTDAKFEDIITEHQFRDLVSFMQLPVIAKVYVNPEKETADPTKAFAALAQITDEDLVDHHNLIAELISALTPAAGVVGARVNFSRLAQRLDEATTNYLNLSPETPKTLSSTELTAFTRSVEKIGRLEQGIMYDIINNPRAFLEMYDKASPALRAHLLVRFFGTSFWTYDMECDSCKDAATLFNLAKTSIRSYIDSLDQIKIDYSRETNLICSQIKVNLPVVKDWPREWTANFAESNCQNKFPKQIEIVLNPAPRQKENQPPKIEPLKLKVSTLIELTVGFGRGLNLWSQDVVDAFVDGRYNKIGPDRPTSIVTILNILRTEPVLSRDHKYDKLKRLTIPQTPPEPQNPSAHPSASPASDL